MTAGFTTERQDPDLSRVSNALVRACQRAREIARQTGTGIAVEIDGELRILQGAELDGEPAANQEQADAG
jgi:broad specificity phosphatase PhoE